MDQKQQNLLALGIALVLLAVAVWQFVPIDSKIRKGLDIQGGLSVILTAQPGARGNAVTSDAMDRAELIVRNRVNALGASEAQVQRQGGNSILVQLPGIKDTQAALKVIGSTGQLLFIDWASVPATEQAAWQSFLYNNTGTVKEPPPLKIGAVQGSTVPSSAIILDGSVVTDARIGANPQTNATTVNMTFDAKGTKEWSDYTSSHIGKQAAIVLDGVVQSAPTIQSAITDGKSEITGKFTPDEAKRLSTVLQTGALPVTLVFSDTRVVGPTLGQDSLARGLMAVVVGLALVALYMAVYYRGLGLLTWLSLGMFACIYLGVLAFLSSLGAFALSLPGIAGVVLTIGLAADSTILILERFKEEVRMGKTFRTAAKSGSRHAIGTSIDADLTTFVSAIVLFLVAIGPVKGFALTLMIGIVVDLVVAILFTRSVLMLLSESVIAKAPGFFGVKGGADNA